jgi:hypothetical protein
MRYPGSVFDKWKSEEKNDDGRYRGNDCDGEAPEGRSEMVPVNS